MRNTVLLTLTVLLLTPIVANAAPADRYDADEGARISESSDGTRRIVIEDDEAIEGESLQPGGVDIQSRVGREHRSLIGIRGEFIGELIALSADI